MRALPRRGLWSLAVIALVALAAWQWQRDRANAPGTLLGMNPDQVTRIRMIRPGHPPRSYAKRNGHWWTDDARPAQADDGRLQAMAAIAAAPVQRWRPLKQLDPHTLGLKPPQLILYLNDQRVEYGVLTPFGPNRYVRVGSRIAIIAARDTPRGPRRKTRKLDQSASQSRGLR